MICIFFMLFGCKKEVKEISISKDTIVQKEITAVFQHQDSLDWFGSYKGVLPCADCEGIATEVVLNYDQTFVIKTKYLGKGDGEILKKKGNFVWVKTGSTILLKGMKGRPSQFKVGNNQLIQLDMEGKIIRGAMAEKYVLKK